MIIAGAWTTIEDAFRDWDGAEEELTKPGTEVLYLEYDCGDYDGAAACIFRRDGLLYEVSDSHCSCNGLEYFKPERTTKEALLMRKQYCGDRTAELHALLEALP